MKPVGARHDSALTHTRTRSQHRRSSSRGRPRAPDNLKARPQEVIAGFGPRCEEGAPPRSTSTPYGSSEWFRWCDKHLVQIALSVLIVTAAQGAEPIDAFRSDTGQRNGMCEDRHPAPKPVSGLNHVRKVGEPGGHRRIRSSVTERGDAEQAPDALREARRLATVLLNPWQP